MTWRRRASALPLRARLVVGFVAAVSIVLTGAGAFVYWRVQFALDRGLATELRQEAEALRPLLDAAGRVPLSATTSLLPGVRDHQVLDADGRVLSAGPELGTQPLLDQHAVDAATAGPVYRDIGRLLPINPRPLRLLAGPVGGLGPAAVLVVAVPRDQRDEALRELLAQLLAAGLGTLLVTALVGDRLARSALVPVERYRTQARRIAAGASGVRLEVPPGRDDEITRLGHTLNDMLGELERSVARERRFVDDASHELRTPLTLMSTRVQLMLRRPRSTSEHEEALRELGADIARLAALAEELLELGAATSTLERDERATTEAADVVAVVASIPAHVEEGGAGATLAWALDVEPAARGARVAVPQHELRRAVLNLLANAAVHGAPPITVHLRRGPGVLVLTVHDEGAGVPSAFLSTATERFTRARGAQNRPGAGLGLSIVEATTARYGGELRLCSQGVHYRYGSRHTLPCEHPAGGTTATVVLPRA